ncbi:MAG: glucose-6-phosphate dehydrogenase [Myxococcales bacterium]|nr:glucose-6-phosphate dehydrogenase [Myxococcales bacterium]MCB9644464.1 glucose-6-phosphate dehydrogenase [Myxococcales bacterium]
MTDQNFQPPVSQASISVVGQVNSAQSDESGRLKEPATIVIFGASGDLSRRKLIPALYHLHRAGFLPDNMAIVGFSRTEISDHEFRETMCQSLCDDVESPETLPQHPLIRSLYYVSGNSNDPESYKALQERLSQIEAERNMPGHRLYYLSVAPALFPFIVQHLTEAGMIYDRTDPRWSRVIIEKPFGHDLQSAQDLNKTITRYLDESQIYRIDHYLGKETVQNILTFRFGNSIFEPLFNQKHVEQVQITVAESLGMEGKRGHYYDKAGAMRDMVQNHMMQLLTLIAMEPPSALEANAIRDEKVKVLRSLLPLREDEVREHTVRAQYTSGMHEDIQVPGFLEEEGVDPNSRTESYVAMRMQIDNWRWAGVPFLLRTGKRLRKRVSEIAVFFKKPPLQFFRKDSNPNLCLLTDRPKANQLIFRIQPDEGISLTFASKRPGMKLDLEQVNMNFFYKQAFAERSPEAYERLLLDALRGDASLFTRSDEVEFAWRFISSVHQGWDADPRPPVHYTAFSDGPREARRLTEGIAPWRPLQNM